MARILLAEPDRKIREFIAGILAEFGHDVQVCENGIEATVWLATALIDVLVTDLVLCSGPSSILSRKCAALRIPMVTLSGQEFHPEGAEEDRPAALLEKPFRFADLQRILNAVEADTRSRAEAQSAA